MTDNFILISFNIKIKLNLFKPKILCLDSIYKIKMHFKITNENECHNGFQYHDGLNILKEKFATQGSCCAGGLYFTDIDNIKDYYSYGCYLREVYLPKDRPDFQMCKDRSEGKWRANMIILGTRRNLRDPSTQQFLIDKMIECGSYSSLLKHGLTEKEIFSIIDTSANIHIDNAVDFCIRYGNDFLLEKLFDRFPDFDITNIIDIVNRYNNYKIMIKLINRIFGPTKKMIDEIISMREFTHHKHIISFLGYAKIIETLLSVPNIHLERSQIDKIIKNLSKTHIYNFNTEVNQRHIDKILKFAIVNHHIKTVDFMISHTNNDNYVNELVSNEKFDILQEFLCRGFAYKLSPESIYKILLIGDADLQNKIITELINNGINFNILSSVHKNIVMSIAYTRNVLTNHNIILPHNPFNPFYDKCAVMEITFGKSKKNDVNIFGQKYSISDALTLALIACCPENIIRQLICSGASINTWINIHLLILNYDITSLRCLLDDNLITKHIIKKIIFPHYAKIGNLFMVEYLTKKYGANNINAFLNACANGHDNIIYCMLGDALRYGFAAQGLKVAIENDKSEIIEILLNYC